MNKSQRAAKRLSATAHRVGQAEKKKRALAEAQHAARELGSDGKKLKTHRTGKKLNEALVREMANRGYRPNGRGGWKRQPKQEVAA